VSAIEVSAILDAIVLYFLFLIIFALFLYLFFSLFYVLLNHVMALLGKSSPGP
jgi:hypothetical protein